MSTLRYYYKNITKFHYCLIHTKLNSNYRGLQAAFSEPLLHTIKNFFYKLLSTDTKMSTQLNLMVAACENMGIGKNGKLPWRLKTEMAYFSKMTSLTQNPNKQNVVIMGRKTWDSIPPKFRPLPGRLNVVISRNPDLKLDESVLIFNSLDAAVDMLNLPQYADKVEKIWIIGGNHIYKLALESTYPCRVYLTKIMKEFDCDTFFPWNENEYTEIRDADVPVDIQEEKSIKFQYKVYEKL